MSDTIAQFHSTYCRITGQSPNPRVHERAWHDFIGYGYTVADLELVLTHIKRQNSRMEGAKYSWRLDKLLDFEYRHFDSLLSEARAMNRNRVKPVTERNRVLAMTGRSATTATADSAKPAKAILEAIVKGL